MKKTINRILVLVLGWALVILGVIGLFVPILQGVLFLLLGLWLLSHESKWAHRCLLKLRMRFPAADRKLKEFQRKFKQSRWSRKAPPEEGAE